MTEIRFYNTLSGTKEKFTPVVPGKVGLYVCGVTVWDSTHVGHARAATVFDVLVRFLRFQKYDVTFVRNFTDVDDKIINRANKEGVSWQEISERYITEYVADMQSLGNLRPNIEPKASEYIEEMIELIKRLIATGVAYDSNGDVFYSVRKFSGYGKLSGKKIEELESGSRVEVNESKEDPLDFALWKASKPGEPSWESPWGNGRPGWHIECSAMASRLLGQPFDIHGGGRDLIFPHHENEIAQSEGCGDGCFVRYWMHNGSLTINDEKMSKSLGNYFTTSKALQRYDHESLRYFLLSSHYRSPLDFSEEALIDAQRALDRVYELSTRLGTTTADPVDRQVLPRTYGAALADKINSFADSAIDMMCDDLNSVKVFGALFEIVRDINKYLDTNHVVDSDYHIWLQQKWSSTCSLLNQLLGVFGSDPAEFRARNDKRIAATRKVNPADIEKKIADRKAARAAKDFATADLIRDQLLEMGVEIKDSAGGTTWQLVE